MAFHKQGRHSSLRSVIFGPSIGHIFIIINFMYLRQLRIIGLKPRSDSGFISKNNDLGKNDKKEFKKNNKKNLKYT